MFFLGMCLGILIGAFGATITLAFLIASSFKDKAKDMAESMMDTYLKEKEEKEKER